jgi:hypothetical protein
VGQYNRVVIGEGANSFGFLNAEFLWMYSSRLWQIDAKSQTAILLLQTIDAPSQTVYRL